jgi:hypothetical protein
LASQGAAQSETEKAEQQCQILHVGKNPNFRGHPPDEREFREQGERAPQKQSGKIPTLRHGRGWYSRFDNAVAGQKNGGQDEAQDAQGH